jgi:hypothetical protein
MYNGTNYPLADTTVNNAYGHFLWAASDFRSNRVNQSSSLYSEILLAYQYQSGACLTFSYFITGSSTINVYLRPRPIGQSSTILWTVGDDQGNKWVQTEIDIVGVADDFEVKKKKRRDFITKNILF